MVVACDGEDVERTCFVGRLTDLLTFHMICLLALYKNDNIVIMPIKLIF